jgi:hypothetical protein
VLPTPPDLEDDGVDQKLEEERGDNPADHGAAIRLITSAPVPWLHIMGRSPMRIAMTVIIFGRIR